MENFSGDFEENMTQFNPKKGGKIPRHSTLLLVRSDGKINQIQQFKALVLIYALVFASAAGSAGWFYFLYQNATEENRHLQEARNDLQEQVRALQGGKKLSISPLTENAETKIKTQVPEVQTSQRKKDDNRAKKKIRTDFPGEKQAPEKVAEKTEPDAEKVEPDEKVEPEIAIASGKEIDKQAEEQTEEKGNDSSADEQDLEQVPPEFFPRILSEKLSVSYDKGRKRIAVRFNVRNPSPGSGRISGNAFVVLKPNTGNQGQWLVMPSTKLVSGKPSGTEAGKRFAIARYTNLLIAAQNQRSPEYFKNATLFIFDESGKLMLEKNFPLNAE